MGTPKTETPLEIWSTAIELYELIDSRIWDLIDSIHEWELAKQQIVSETLTDLAVGRLLAYGYRPENLDEVEMIPPQIWIAANLSEDLDGVSRCDGISFRGLRVVEVDPKTHLPPSTSRKAGRPSTRSQIELKAKEYLADKAFKELPRKHQADELRRRWFDDPSERPGYSDRLVLEILGKLDPRGNQLSP